MFSLFSYECNLKTMVQVLSLFWLLFLPGILWVCLIFTLLILSLDFNMQFTFSLYWCQFSSSVSSYSTTSILKLFSENCPLSSVTFPLFPINDRLSFCMVSKVCIYVTHISVHRFNFPQVNLIRMFYTSLEIIRFTI